MNIKNILLFGDSLTWGAIAGEGNFRFEKSERIAGFLQDLLGGDYEIIEEGRPGRTVATDDRTPSRNGLTSFENAISSHGPLDYIFIMLGTNDIKNKFNKKSAKAIAQDFSKYRDIIENFNSNWEVNFNPKIILVAPPIINENYLPAHYKEDFGGRQAISQNLAQAYSGFVAQNQNLNIHFIDASRIKVSEGDGVHLDVEQNREVVQLYFNFIKKYEN